MYYFNLMYSSLFHPKKLIISKRDFICLFQKVLFSLQFFIISWAPIILRSLLESSEVGEHENLK